ncbi:MAG TPA: transcriptional repressor [Anaerohalosphaeraceae bacterium]|nr:transcriptional repressor [Anaerohalosphaeraceae bacterium]HOL87727.1 transcriptional repressor [Anaerohalosphaeraceae bacterium]HPP55766.1 transcriptional repressor [Anaerohalosphaeraceae bacterium]
MTDEHLQKAAQLLDENGLRKTRPRLEILCVLLEADSPLTGEQVFERVTAGSVDKATVYRTLLLLLKHDIVHNAYLRNRIRHFELAHHCKPDRCHPHFTCRDCGRTVCLYQAIVPDVQNLPAGFLVLHRQTRLEGICADCRVRHYS